MVSDHTHMANEQESRERCREGTYHLLHLEAQALHGRPPVPYLPFQTQNIFLQTCVVSLQTPFPAGHLVVILRQHAEDTVEQ